jgi:tRNA modification GTPase
LKEKTIIAISTALGKGAIGVIKLSGFDVLDIIKNFVFLKNGQKLENIESHKVYLAEVKDLQNHGIIDEVMFVFMKAPKTYTGEDVVEISCHNNFYILNKILELGKNFGARLAKAGEFTERAFLNGKLDLSQAEAVLDVIHAESNYAENVAQKQLKGGLTKEVSFFRDELLDILKDLEIVLDHDGIMNLDAKKLLDNLQNIRAKLDRKIKLGQRTNKFFHGIKVALIGRPNVGKSSILNSIINKEKAIVSDIPGTTRDPIEVVIEHKKIKIEIVDTAGLKNAEEFESEFENHGMHGELEKKGIIKTKEYLEQADVVFFIIDLSQKVEKYDEILLNELGEYFKDKKIILVGNKKDLCDREILKELEEGDEKLPLAPSLKEGGQEKEKEKEKEYVWEIKNRFKVAKFVMISAKSGENIDKLLDFCIDDFLETNENGESEQNFMVNARHKFVFDDVIASLDLAIDLVNNDEPLEMIAVDIRRVIDLLGEILGLGIDEEILNRIFSNFCVGK